MPQSYKDQEGDPVEFTSLSSFLLASKAEGYGDFFSFLHARVEGKECLTRTSPNGQVMAAETTKQLRQTEGPSQGI